MINYSPAALFLLIAFLTAYRREKHGAYLFGVSGMVLTFAAALCQQLGLGLHPIYFNHNAVYHVIQAVALFLIFLAARRLATTQSVTGEDQC